MNITDVCSQITYCHVTENLKFGKYIYLYRKRPYPSPKMAFSVIPNKAVAQAQTNIIRPKKI